MAVPDIRKLDLSDSDSDDLLTSPSRTTKSRVKDFKSTNQHSGESRYDSEQAREMAFQRELEGVRSINEVIEGVLSSLECAKGNMDVR